METREDNRCSGSMILGACANADLDAWNEAEGRYEFSVQWEGICGVDDSQDFFLVIRAAGVTVVNRCDPYRVSLQMVYTDEACVPD